MLPLVLSSQEWSMLEEYTNGAILTTEARRAQALLWIAEGADAQTVAVRLHISRQTVYNWISAFEARRNEPDLATRLADKKRSGRPPSPARMASRPSPNAHELQMLEEFAHQARLTNESRRAQALLWIAEGKSAEVIAVRLHVSRQTVYNWIAAFEERRSEPNISARLADKKRTGRPPTTQQVTDGPSP